MLKFFISFFYKVSPKIFFDFACYLEGFKNFKISFAQSGEDLILLNYLKYKKIKKGKYLDIGAFHPRWASNTHILHKKGFSGYVIDIDENRLKWFKFARGNKIKIICGAVSNLKKEYIKVYKFIRKSPFSLVDTTSLKHANRFYKKGNIPFKVIKVKNLYINDIFNQVGKINVLNIDIESKDFEVLKSSNLKIINPEIILLEEGSNFFPTQELINFFKKFGYQYLSSSGLTKIFAKK